MELEALFSGYSHRNVRNGPTFGRLRTNVVLAGSFGCAQDKLFDCAPFGRFAQDDCLGRVVVPTLPQVRERMGHPFSCCCQQTAGPSASLGMTNLRRCWDRLRSVEDASLNFFGNFVYLNE